MELADERIREAKALSSMGKNALAHKTLQRHQDLVTLAEVKAIEVKEVDKKTVLAQRIFKFKKDSVVRLKAVPLEAKPVALSAEPIEGERISLVRAAKVKYGLFLEQAQIECVNSGGEWRGEADFVGCLGAGIADCRDNLLFSEALNLCHSLGGKVNCSFEGVYCRR